MYIRHVFGLEASEYVRSELARYPQYNCLRRLLSDLPIESGSVFAFLPASPPMEVIQQYGAEVLRHSLDYYFGGVFAVDPEYTAHERAFVSNWLRSDPRHVATFQAAYSRFEAERAPFRTAPGERLFLCSKPANAPTELAHEGWVFIDQSQSNPEEIELAIARGTRPYPPVVGLLTSLPDGMTGIDVLQELGPNEYAQFAQKASYLIVEAFDLEALLFWQAPAI